MATKNAKLKILVDAETRAFLRKFGNVKKVAGNVMKGVAVAGVAGGAAMIYATKKAAEYGDEIGKMARRTGLGVENLQQLKHAAELSGTNLEAIEKGTRRLQKNIYDLGRGLSTSTDAFGALGLSMEDVEGKSTDEQLNTVMMALAGVEDQAKQAGIAQDLFGRSGTQLLPMLQQGQYELAAMKGEASDLGIVMSAESIKASENFQDSLLRLKSSVAGASRQMGAGAFAGGITAMDNMRAAVQGMAESGALERIGAAAGGVAVTLSEMASDPDNIEAMVSLIEGGAIAMEGLATATAKTVKFLADTGRLLEGVAYKLGLLKKETETEQTAQKVVEGSGGDLELAAARNLKQKGVNTQRSDQAFFVLLHEEMKRIRILQEQRLPEAS